MEKELSVVGIGEALFDVFAGKRKLGGAPLNVAVHVNQLSMALAAPKIKSFVASRVGKDALGEELFNELKKRRMDVSCLQVDAGKPTGTVDVYVDENGQPDYEINRGVAWDELEFDDNWQNLAQTCSAVCFGTLAQRGDTSRAAINKFLEACPVGAVRMFDVNLRFSNGKPCYDLAVLEKGLELCNILKLNQDELVELARLAGAEKQSNDDALFKIINKYNLDMAVFTQGKLGTQVYKDGEIFKGNPVSYPPAESADSVGAGDSCSAAVIVGLLCGFAPGRIADIANHIGAFVASKPGALPSLPEAILRQFG